MARAGAEDEPQHIPAGADARGHGDGEAVLSRTARANGDERRHTAAMENRDDGRAVGQRDGRSIHRKGPLRRAEARVTVELKASAVVPPAPEVGVCEVCVGVDVEPPADGGCVAGAVVVVSGVVGSGTEMGGIVGVEIVGQDSGRTTQLPAGDAADDAAAPASAPAPSTRASAQGRANRVAEAGGWGEGPHRRGRSEKARLATYVTSRPVCQLAPRLVSKRSLVGVSKEHPGLQLISPQNC
jgi:hypothetical protein